MAQSTYVGPGELLLAPSSMGDVTMLRLNGNEKAPWQVGKDTFLATTQGVVKEYKSQGIGKAMFSGEGLFVYRMSGSGIVWIASLGAIIRKDVRQLSMSDLGYPMRLAEEMTDFLRCSFKKGRSISSTTGTWWHGIATMWSSVQQAEA